MATEKLDEEVLQIFCPTELRERGTVDTGRELESSHLDSYTLLKAGGPGSVPLFKNPNKPVKGLKADKTSNCWIESYH